MDPLFSAESLLLPALCFLVGFFVRRYVSQKKASEKVSQVAQVETHQNKLRALRKSVTPLVKTMGPPLGNYQGYEIPSHLINEHGVRYDFSGIALTENEYLRYLSVKGWPLPSEDALASICIKPGLVYLRVA